MDKPRILLVEDEEDIHKLYQEQLGGDFDIIQAWNIQEAFELFQQHWRTLSAIIMDGLLGQLNTIELTRHIRKRFNGPVIANTNSEYHQKKLIAAGCQHFSRSKNKVEEIIRNLLKLPT